MKDQVHQELENARLALQSSPVMEELEAGGGQDKFAKAKLGVEFRGRLLVLSIKSLTAETKTTLPALVFPWSRSPVNFSPLEQGGRRERPRTAPLSELLSRIV